jgi:endonuclease/exonuclease/phosphatase family metal-dependent hydrolase
MPDQDVVTSPDQPDAPAAGGPDPAAGRFAGLRDRWARRWPDRWVRADRGQRQRWGRGTRVAVVVGVAWLLLTVGQRVLSGRVWWWSTADVAPPLLFAVVPLLLLGVAQLTRPVRWRLTLVALVALVLGAGVNGFNLATLFYSPPPAPPGAISVVSWNTEYWDQDWSSHGRHDSTDFYRYLSGQHADVYLLQEYAHLDLSLPDVFAQAQVIDATPQLRQWFPGYHYIAMGRDITLSRFPVVRVEGVDSTPWLPPDLRQVPPAQRDHPQFYTTNAIRTDLMINGRVVSFYNVHLDQPPAHYTMWKGATRAQARFNDAKRQASYRAIRAAVEADHNPIVFGGDLNTSPAMGIRRLLPGNLVDHTNALSSLYPFTWKARSLRPWWRVDWLLTTPDVRVHHYEIVDTDRRSDHRMQRLVLSVTG